MSCAVSAGKFKLGGSGGSTHVCPVIVVEVEAWSAFTCTMRDSHKSTRFTVNITIQSIVEPLLTDIPSWMAHLPVSVFERVDRVRLEMPLHNLAEGLHGTDNVTVPG